MADKKSKRLDFARSCAYHSSDGRLCQDSLDEHLAPNLLPLSLLL